MDKAMKRTDSGAAVRGGRPRRRAEIRLHQGDRGRCGRAPGPGLRASTTRGRPGSLERVPLRLRRRWLRHPRTSSAWLGGVSRVDRRNL